MAARTRFISILLAVALTAAMIPVMGLFASAAEYSLRVEGVDVTDDNRADILADVTYSPSEEYPVRTAAYDPSSNTLTLGGRFGAPGGSLRNWISGLTVNFAADTFLGGAYDDIVSLGAPTTFRGPGTVSIVCSGSMDACIFTGESLVLDGVTLELTGSTGMRGYPSPALTIKDSYIKSEGTISGFSSGIYLEGCHIAYPEGAYITGGAIVDSTGSLAENIVIVPNGAAGYGLRVQDVDVTEENRTDILANDTYTPSEEYPVRTAVYDPALNTLTMGGRFGAPGGSLRNHNSGLTVYFAADTFLGGAYDDIVSLGAPTTFKGPGTVSVVCSGSMDACIFTGESLVLDGVTLELTGSTGMRGYPSPALIIKDSYIRSEGTISGFSGGIYLEGCHIASPEGAYILGGAVVDSTGSLANNIVIVPDEKAVRSNPFVDISETDEYYDAVLWAFYAEPQVTNGMDTTHFGPWRTVTRGQAVTFLWRAMGCPEPTITGNAFADVAAKEYYYKPVLWAVEKGITKGVDDTHFNPDGILSTQHIVTFIYRTLNPGADGWYGEAEAWAADENGKPFGVDIAVSNITECPRCRVVQFLYRLSK